ncbi:MAG: hypothetical protein O7G84_01045 [Gammaproteobacteria bacterium]|nr:hypothetical protein [Gammaproteobacteria bacterium]
MKRRGFLKLIGIGAAGTAVAPLVGANAQETVERDAGVNWNPACPNPLAVKLDGPTLISVGDVPRLISGGIVTLSDGNPSEFDVGAGEVVFPLYTDDPWVPFSSFVSIGFLWHKDYSCVGINHSGKLEVHGFDAPKWLTPIDQRRLVHLATVYHWDHNTVTSIEVPQRLAAL